MRSVAISKFKAECLGILETVRRTGEPVLVTRFGKPVAEVVPPSSQAQSDDWIDSMAGKARIVGDLIEPVASEEEWEVLRD